MSRLADIGKNKNIIMSKLLTNEQIIKCLLDNSPDFLNYSIPNNYDITQLLYSHIYPYKKIPNPEEDAKTFITMSFNFRPNGMTFKNGSIYFYIFTHQSLVQTNSDMLRYDFIANQIDETFNSSRDITIGKLEFFDMGDFQVNDNWLGASIGYKSTEFN